MSKKNNNDLLEETDEIKVEDAEIGRFNLIIFAIITLICLIYLATHLTKPG